MEKDEAESEVRVIDYGMSEQGLRDRLTHNEEAVQNLSERFLTHERFVHTQFSAFDAKLDNLEEGTRQSETKIIDKLTALQVSSQARHSVSWPLVISICSLVVGILVVIAGGFANESRARAVNTAISEFTYNTQQGENEDFREWVRRVSDRTRENAINITEYYEHREGLALEDLIDHQIERLSALETRLAALSTRVDGNTKAIDRNSKFVDESIESRAYVTAQVKEIQADLNNLSTIAAHNVEQLGKLEPLTNDMGMMSLQGAIEKLDLLEEVVKAIDSQGSRKWNEANPR